MALSFPILFTFRKALPSREEGFQEKDCSAIHIEYNADQPNTPATQQDTDFCSKEKKKVLVCFGFFFLGGVGFHFIEVTLVY